MEDLKILHLTLPSLEGLMEDLEISDLTTPRILPPLQNGTCHGPEYLPLNWYFSGGLRNFGITPSHIELLMEDFKWWTGVWDRCISRGYRLVCTVGRLGKCSPSKQVAGK